MGVEDVLVDYTRRDWERESVDGTVRLAVVGVGEFARGRSLPAIDAGAYCETTVLVSESVERRTGADEFDVEAVIDYDEFHAGEYADAYDAVYVATPNAVHGEYVVAAAERGKHVLCEKPLESTAERAARVIDACDEADVTLMIAYRLQAEPTVRRTRDLVADGAVGEIVQIHGGFSNPLLEYADPDSWRLDPDLSGGGALVDLGIYPLNTARYILEDDPVTVSADTYSSGAPFDEVDQHVAFQLSFPSGVTASCTASFDAHASSQLQLIGTDGTISIASPFGGVVPHEIDVERRDVRMEYTGPPTDEVREEFDYFGYHVLTGTDPEPDGQDGLTDLRVIESTYESAETGEKVRLG